MTGQVNSISDRDMRILTHYAAGTELKGIAQILGMDREDVMEVVGEFTGYERKKAGDLVAAHQKRQRAQTPKLPVEPIIDRPAPAAPTKPASDLAPALDAFINPDAMPAGSASIVTALPPAPEPKSMAETVTAAMEKIRNAAKTTWAAPEPTPAPVPDLDIRPISRTPVETVLARAVAAGGRYAKQAAKIREQVVALDADLAEHQRLADKERRVEELTAQLAAAREELRAARGRPVSPAPATPAPQRAAASTSTIRAWAKANGIEVNPLGVLPRHVIDQYLAANQDVA